ncbi:MAG: GNAT family N-acetyltransferase [Planctomycetaceae bacterium]
MRIEPLDPASVETVAGWLAEEANRKWLDFGGGFQSLSALAIRVMQQRGSHQFRLFFGDDPSCPAGVAGLVSIDPKFGTAALWYVLGDKRYARRGITTRAVAAFLAEAFGPLGLQAVNAWAVDRNVSSQRVLEKCGFMKIGRQRRCHVVDGEACDRIHYDFLPGELVRP